MSIEKVLDLYGIEQKIVEKHSESDERAVWTINNEYILKETIYEEEMAKNIKLTTLLTEHKIPVQKYIKSVDGLKYVNFDSKYYALYGKIKGHTITDYFSGDYEKNAFYIGKCIGSLHIGLKEIYDKADREELSDNHMIDEVRGWAHTEIEKFLSDGTVSEEESDAFEKLYSYISKDFVKTYIALPRQLIHRDMHGENLIFKDNEFKGFIDFDLSQVNARIYDPCYMCTAALSTVFDKEEERKKWTNFAQQVIRGYDDTVQLTDNEKKSIKSMMILNEIIMIAFFCKYGYPEIAYTNLKMALYIDEISDELII